jgi:16S rRNA C1402 N4-methylase RsmH
MRERSSRVARHAGHPNTAAESRHHLRDVKRFLPSEEEIEKNPRARSARLRVAIRNEEIIMSRNRMRNSQSLHWMAWSNGS